MKNKIRKWLKDSQVLVILIIVALTVKSSLIEIYVVPTGSMEDEILVGDLMIGNKFTYGMRTPNWIGIPYTRKGFYIPALRLPKFKEIENGDVAMFEFPRDPFQKYVKRCIGIAGDSISINLGNIFVNKKLMPFPNKAKYITFGEADFDNDGEVYKTINDKDKFFAKDGNIYDADDIRLINSKNEMRFNVAMNKINFLNDGNANKYNTFNRNDVILFNEDYQLNPFKSDYLFKTNEDVASIQSQFINNQIYPYFSGNNDNLEEFVVPYKDMNINIEQWFKNKKEWISFITLLVQDGNNVTLDSVKYIMEDPESIAQISGILRYKLFPNREKRFKNYHKIKGNLKIKNKNNRKDNPWYIYENPILNQMNNYSNMPSLDLNQDSVIDSNDLVNNSIWDSFISSHNPNDLAEILNDNYNGNAIAFILDYYKSYADDYIFNNLKVNGVPLMELENYIVKHDYYMFIGDNRDNSYDSRIWGFVPDYQILGTPLLSLLNVSKFKLRFKTIN